MGDNAPLILLARNPNYGPAPGNDDEKSGLEPREEPVWIQGPPLSGSEPPTSPSPRPRPRRTNRWRTESSESESELFGPCARVPRASPRPEPERAPNPKQSELPTRASPQPERPTARITAGEGQVTSLLLLLLLLLLKVVVVVVTVMVGLDRW